MTDIKDIATKDNGFLKVKGLPYKAGFNEIKEFFKEFEVVNNGIYRAYQRDRPSGECFVIMKDS